MCSNFFTAVCYSPTQESEIVKDLFHVMVTLYESSNTRLANALPKSWEDAKIAKEKGSPEISVPNKVRSIEWLKENGMCLDNIVARKSRIVQAGHGAFATRRIQKGGIISPVPLVQIRREHLEIYDADDVGNPKQIWYVAGDVLLTTATAGN